MSRKKAAETSGEGVGGGNDTAPKAKQPLVRNRYVALVGLLGLALLAVMMLRGQLGLVAAGQRAGVLLGVVLVTERLVLPVCRALVGPPGSR